MKKSFLAPALFALTISAATTILPDAACAQASPPAESDAGPNAGQHEQGFEQRKAAVLQRIGNHIAEMQKRQACVQAAADPKSLRECMPEREGHRGGGGGGAE